MDQAIRLVDLVAAGRGVAPEEVLIPSVAALVPQAVAVVMVVGFPMAIFVVGVPIRPASLKGMVEETAVMIVPVTHHPPMPLVTEIITGHGFETQNRKTRLKWGNCLVPDSSVLGKTWFIPTRTLRPTGWTMKHSHGL
jgi:hypothetical protein